ncbi:MAG: hypothetical protein PHO20_03130 [Candidatus Peribacteraceae bacterium]|nr:hypothetical protein [Candidatus Peribacteraceae bacterium]MDD5739734.1 hypothetical protein [Candidatus Peribacteraceae bacterium]
MNNVDQLVSRLAMNGCLRETVNRSRPVSEWELETGDVLEAVESLELPRGMICEPGTLFTVANVDIHRVEFTGADKPLVRVEVGGVPVEESTVRFRVTRAFVQESMRRIVS